MGFEGGGGGAWFAVGEDEDGEGQFVGGGGWIEVKING